MSSVPLSTGIHREVSDDNLETAVAQLARAAASTEVAQMHSFQRASICLLRMRESILRDVIFLPHTSVLLILASARVPANYARIAVQIAEIFRLSRGASVGSRIPISFDDPRSVRLIWHFRTTRPDSEQSRGATLHVLFHFQAVYCRVSFNWLFIANGCSLQLLQLTHIATKGDKPNILYLADSW